MEQVMGKIGLEEKPIKSERSSSRNGLQTAQQNTMLGVLWQTMHDQFIVYKYCKNPL